MRNPDNMIVMPSEWFTGMICPSLGRHATEIQEFCKHSLMDDSDRSSEGQNGDKNLDSRVRSLEDL